MNKTLTVIMLLAGISLFVLAFHFYQKAEKQKRYNQSLTDMMTSNFDDLQTNAAVDETPVPEPDDVYDPSDLDQTPPGIEPYMGSTACSLSWGLQVRQYCADGDNAVIDSVEGGFGAEENLEMLSMCLDESLVRIDVYGQDKSYVESEVQQNEENRKALACELVAAYGDLEVFDKASLYSMLKEHVESGDISRLVNR